MNLHIYCDGGLGNRLNSLISGLAVSKILGVKPTIFWPSNNWCMISLYDLIETDIHVVNIGLAKYKSYVNNEQIKYLFHDTVASKLLGVTFNSIYAFSNFDEFKRSILNSDIIFYYPALIPKWVDEIYIKNIIKEITFNKSILDEFYTFKNEHSLDLYYGIHLRRTDLVTGYRDDEVVNILFKHDHKFLICSDDESTENKFSKFNNVIIKRKNSYVQKKQIGGWLDRVVDDEGRHYHGNIFRSAASVREAMIDLLLLSDSTIVGNSGSTFLQMAKLLSSRNNKSDSLPPISMPALNDELRNLRATSAAGDVANKYLQIKSSIGQEAGLRYLLEAVNYGSVNLRNSAAWILPIELLNLGLAKAALTFLHTLHTDYDDTAMLYSAIAHQRLGDHLQYKDIIKKIDKNKISNNKDRELYDAIVNKLQ